MRALLLCLLLVGCATPQHRCAVASREIDPAQARLLECMASHGDCRKEKAEYSRLFDIGYRLCVKP